MTIDNADKFGIARESLEKAMDLLLAIEEITDADGGRNHAGNRAVARAASDALVGLHELFFEKGDDETGFAAMKAA